MSTKSETRKSVVTYVGATGRSLQFVAKTSAGAVYDLTDLTLTLTAKHGGTTMIDDAACSVVSAEAGTFQITPTAEQVATAGEYNAQVKIENGSGGIDYLEQFVIDVRAVV